MSLEILNSIKVVSEISSKSMGRNRPIFQPASASALTDEEKNILLESIKTVSLQVSAYSDEVDILPSQLNRALQNLGIERSEEAHSSAIATCFNSPSEKIGMALLTGLLAAVGVQKSLRPSQLRVSRERRLGSLPWTRALPADKQDRRLDVLIEHTSLVLAIENKIDSFESVNQTADYYQALQMAFGGKKEIVCIYLTPNGIPANDPHFAAVSYPNLFSSFNKAVAAFPEQEAEFVRFYLRQLFTIFVEPQQRAHQNAKNYWKGKSV